MSNFDFIGYVAGIIVVGSMLPQLIKSWRTRSTKDISGWRYIAYSAGLSIWIVYGYLDSNGHIMVMNWTYLGDFTSLFKV